MKIDEKTMNIYENQQTSMEIDAAESEMDCPAPWDQFFGPQGPKQWLKLL